MCTGPRSVPRRRAAVDLPRAAFAAWPGEVVIVAAPDADAAAALVRVARQRGGAAVCEIVVDAPGRDVCGRVHERVHALVAPPRSTAVLVALRLAPDARGRRRLAAVRYQVGRRAPCRAVWLFGGRVYPE